MDKEVWYVYVKQNITQPLKRWNDGICSNMSEPKNYHAE